MPLPPHTSVEELPWELWNGVYVSIGVIAQVAIYLDVWDGFQNNKESTPSQKSKRRFIVCLSYSQRQ